MTSKEEYLKKYLGGGEKKKKKKKGAKKANKSSVIILDDNPNWGNSGQSNDEDDSDTPIIVEYHDEQKEMEMKARWRPVAKQDVKEEIKEESQFSPSHSYKPTDEMTQGRRNQRHDSDSSPERQPSHRSRRDETTGGGSDAGYDSDPSPPRRRAAGNNNHSDSDVSPPRRRQSDSDASPPRRRHSDSDASPPRRRHGDFDPSPPRRRRGDRDASPPQRRRGDRDASPPRRRPHQQQSSDGGKRRQERSEHKLQTTVTGVPSGSRSTEGAGDHSSRERSGSNKIRMAGGGKAGLQSGKEVKVQKQSLKDIDDSILGKGAETVYRNKDGKRIDPKLENLKKKEEERKKAEQDEQFYEWGRGVAQTRMAHEKVADDLHEMSKPLARYKDDEDLENMLKAREREDDPMLEYIKSKKAKKNVIIDSHGRKRPKKERPTYKGSHPPNRFSIRPGYRWDGIDRSNGFEQSWFAREANKVAIAEVAYKWSVEDM